MMPWDEPNCICGHPWEGHSLEVGCRAAWVYEGAGLASASGCKCTLAHVQRSNHDG